MSVRVYSSSVLRRVSQRLGASSKNSSMADPSPSVTTQCSGGGTEVEAPTHDPLPGASLGKRKMASKQYKTHPRKMFKSNYEARFDETNYFFDKGFRRVKPYVYAFETFAKGRWYGQKLLDVFKKEFRLETPAFYAKAIETGLIKINGERTTADYVIRNNDFMHSRVHRHEPPVTSDPIDIVEKTDEFVVVNKPPSMPVHPCGKYRHNTVVFLLAKEHNLIHLHTIHRLDRLTSGLLIFARTKAASQRIDAFVRERKLKKTYVCKVSGEFPSGIIECNEPIFIVSHKIGVCRVRADGKPCKTTFERISYNGKTSIVKCFPETGRMHQIRVHLQYLGHPIQNDPLYNNPVWGPARGQGGSETLTDDQLLERLVEQHDEERVTRINEYLDERSSRKPVAGNLHQNTHRNEKPTQERDNLRLNSDHNRLNSTDCMVAEIGSSKGNIECNLVDAGNHCGGDRVTSTTGASNPGRVVKQAADGPLPEVTESSENKDVTGRAGAASENLLSESVESSSSSVIGRTERYSRETADAIAGKEGGLKSSEQRMIVTPEEGVSATDERSMTAGQVTEMDGTLTGIGVLEVDEERLQELADEGSEASVDQIARMLCRECVTPLPDPRPEEMMIYLHALSYKGPDFEFSTPLPKWAMDHMEEGALVPGGVWRDHQLIAEACREGHSVSDQRT